MCNELIPAAKILLPFSLKLPDCSKCGSIGGILTGNSGARNWMLVYKNEPLASAGMAREWLMLVCRTCGYTLFMETKDTTHAKA